MASAAAPFLAQGVKHLTTNDKPSEQLSAAEMASNALGHAVVGDVVANVSGGNAKAGAAGAAAGELVAHAATHLIADGKSTQDLTQSEREQISQWGQIAGGVAGGLAGGGKNHAAEIGAGAPAGKNAVEHNALRPDQDSEKLQDYEKCGEGAAAIACKTGTFFYWAGISTYQTGRSAAVAAGGVVVGAGQWGVDTAISTYNFVRHPWDSTVAVYDAGYGYVTSGNMRGIAYNAGERFILNTWDTVVDTVQYGLFVEDPAKAYDAGKRFGHVGAEVGSFFIPVGAVAKVGTAGKVGAAFEKVGLEGLESATSIATVEAAGSIVTADKVAADAISAAESSPKITITEV